MEVSGQPPKTTDAENKCQNTEHGGETIKFYCRSHSTFGCGSCMIIDHHDCDKPVYIEEEYKNFEAKVKKLNEQHSEKKNQNSAANEKNHSKVVKDIKHFMKEVKEHIERLETTIITEADKLKDDNEQKMNDISIELETLTSDLSKLHQTQQNEKLFTMIKETSDKLETLAKKIEQMNEENTVQLYSFKPEKKIKSTISKVATIGKLVLENKQNDEPQNDIILGTSEEDNLTSDKAMASKSNILTKTGARQQSTSQTTLRQEEPTTFTAPENKRKKQTDVKTTRASKIRKLGETITSENTQATETAQENTRRENDDVRTTRASKKSKKVTFETQDSLPTGPSTSDTAGNIQQFPFTPRQASEILDINVESPTDETENETEEPYIKGLALMPDDKLIFADKRNLKVKLINIKQNRIITELKLPSQPYDITVVSDNQVAMTMPSANQIQLMSISNQEIYRDQIIKVKGECYGIVHNEGTFLVTFVKSAKVKMISMSGSILRVIDKGTNGEPLFVEPDYIALSLDNTHVYISDRYKETVTCMTLNGEVKGEYQDRSLYYPRGLIVDKTGSVYVVGGTSVYYIYQLSGDCRQGQKLLGEEQGLDKCPMSITYCHKEDKLYVGYVGSSIISLFQLKQ